MPMPPKHNNAKKAKLYNSRSIRTELNDANFVDNEKLNIPEFLKSRTFEIKSFELSQLKSKYAQSKRVFQNLPRTLRRRTASHNVKRIPKRLRNRALREMKSSTVDTVPSKNLALKKRSLYKLKMAKKLLKLGSRLKLLKQFPDEALFDKKINLRERINLLNSQIKQLSSENISQSNNILGAHDRTGINEFASRPSGNWKFFKRQSQFIWLPTHIWHAKRFHMIKKYGYQLPLSPTQKCFKLMNRTRRTGSVVFDMSYYKTLIVEIEDDEKLHDILLSITKFKKRIPDCYLNGNKSYDNTLYINNVKIGEGLVFANKNINKVLFKVFPSIYDELFEYLKSIIDQKKDKVFDCKYSLGNLEIAGPSSINTLGKILHLFKDQDTKLINLWYSLSTINDSDAIPFGTTFAFDIKDPRFWKNPVSPKIDDKFLNSNDLIIELSKGNLINLESLSGLFDNHKRNESYRNQMSIKQIDREFARIKPTANSISNNDRSKIPILITKLSSGNWNIILPWFWLLPLWSKIVKVRHVKVGGFNQLKQFKFERSIPSFPNDCQYLKDGWLYNKFLEQINKKKYEQLPKSKQINFKAFEGELSPFSCDWCFLKSLSFGLKFSGGNLLNEANFGDYDENLKRNLNNVNDLIHLIRSRRKEDEKAIPIEIFDKFNEFHRNFVSDNYHLKEYENFPKLPVIQISVSLVYKGSIKDNARIYQLPCDVRLESYAKSNISVKHNPDITNLIGFVTSGAFNLNIGTSSGIGLIKANFQDIHVLIRNVGCSSFYLASLKRI